MTDETDSQNGALQVKARHPNSRTGCWREAAPNEAAKRRRHARVAEGEAQRVAEAAAWPGRRVTRSELILPLLQLLDEAGVARPVDLYVELARRLNLDETIREVTREYEGRTTVVWDRTVRWAMQEGKRQGLMARTERGKWTATDRGGDVLGRVTPGIRIVVFRTDLGQAVAALAEEAAAVVDPDSLQILFTSPIFPLARGKSYGTMNAADWIGYMLDMLHGWLPLLKHDGCMVIHLGQVHHRGMPAISSYRERFLLAALDELGLYRMPDLFWEQPSRWPPMEWGSVRKMAPRPTVDPLYVLSKSSSPYLDFGQALVPYAHPDDPRRGKVGRKEVRPSGLDIGPTSYRDNGGSLPASLIRAGAVSGADPWRVAVRNAGLPAHPCPMPLEVPRFALRCMTKIGDLAGDFFFGSGTLGACAEEMGRRWVGIDHHRVLLEGASYRPQFRQAPGFKFRPDEAA